MALIWIVGELNVDLIVRDQDITPQPGREKLVEACELALGSSSAITAAVIAGLGHEVRMVSVVGDDLFGRFVLEELNKTGVDTTYVTVTKQVRTGVTVSLSDDVDRSLLTYMGSIAAVSPEYIPDEVYESGDHLHFGSYFLQTGMKGHWAGVLQRAKEAGMTTSFDTGWDVEEKWEMSEFEEILAITDYFIPNEEEILHLTRAENVEQALGKLPAKRGNVALKRGGDGSLLIRPDGERIQREPFRVKAIDTTGAGDSFNAGLIHGIVTRMSLEESLDFANASGALAVKRIGGAGDVPDVAAIETFMKQYSR